MSEFVIVNRSKLKRKVSVRIDGGEIFEMEIFESLFGGESNVFKERLACQYISSSDEVWEKVKKAPTISGVEYARKVAYTYKNSIDNVYEVATKTVRAEIRFRNS